MSNYVRPFFEEIPQTLTSEFTDSKNRGCGLFV